MTEIAVLVAEDQPLIRAGIVLLLESQPDLSVVAEAGDGQEAVDLALAHRPDVVLMDLKMPVLDGVSATRQLCADRAEAADRLTAVLVLTTFDDDEAVYGALLAGASGYVLKQAVPQDLLTAIRRVADGEVWIDPAVAGRVLTALRSTFETFHLDIGTGDPIVGPLDYLTTTDLLAFADIPPVIVPCYPLTQQLAEKVHAFTLTYKSGETTRVKDWVDILLIAEMGRLNAQQLFDSVQATFDARATHALPEKMSVPPASWERTFKKLATEVPLDVNNIQEASKAVSQFLDPILTGHARGHWNPTSWEWE